MANVHDGKNRHDGRNGDDLKDLHGVVERSIAPQVAIESGNQEDEWLDRQNDPQAFEEDCPLIGRYEEVEPEEKGGDVGDRNQGDINGKNKQTSLVEHGPSLSLRITWKHGIYSTTTVTSLST